MQTKKIIETNAKYLIKSYAPHNVVIAKGNGSKVYDTDGKEYIDFLAGIATSVLGHNNKKIVAALNKQSKKIMLTSGYFHNEHSGKLAKELIKNTHFKRAFFTNSGAESNECALKIAKKYMKDNHPERFKVVTCNDSFHGRTIATVTATGQDKYKAPFTPLPDWFIYVPFNDTNALKKALSDPEVGAFIVECIQGEGGIKEASPEFMQTARKITQKRDQIMIIDEVQTGANRTGKWFSYMYYGIKPDIITLAKGMGGGFPVGACLISQKLEEVIQPGDHGTTYGGNPLAMAVSYAVIKEIKKPQMLEHFAGVSDYFILKLKELAEKKDCVVEFRGKGLLLGLNLKSAEMTKAYVSKLLENGILCCSAGGDTLRFVPPFIITKEEIDILIDKLDTILN